MSGTPSGFTAITQGALVEKDGRASYGALKLFTDWNTRLTNGLNLIGQFIGNIGATATIGNRTEGIGTTVQHITPTGQLNSLTNVAADVDTDHVADGTGNPLAGGKRGYTALDANSKLPGSSATPNMQLNAVNFATVQGVDLGATAGAQIYGAGGAGTQWTGQVGTSATGPYPAGSVSGLAYSTQYVCYYDSINAVYVATTTIPDSLNDYYVYVGTFTTPAAGGGGGATFNVSMNGVPPTQTVAFVGVLTGGNFTGTPSIAFSGGGTPSRQASGYAVMSGSAISSITVTDPGQGYSSAPTLTATGGTSGATGGGGSVGGVGGKGVLAGITP